LRRVSLTIEAGQLVGLLGPNGAGKSTLLGVLATLANPSTGSVTYGQVASRSADVELRRCIGLLSHELQIYAELTARENLEFFARLYGLDDPVGRSQRALERANLDARADDVVEGFSRGMRQRLALERTLLHEPRLVLLDEPFTGLDESSSLALRERLRDLRDDGRLVLVATHDLDVADGLLDRAVLMKDGRLTEFDLGGGTLRERYRATLASETR
jgi:heme exporter protein A